MKRVKAPLDKTAIGFDKTAIGLDKTAIGLDNMAIGLGRLDKTAIDLDKIARWGWKWLVGCRSAKTLENNKGSAFSAARQICNKARHACDEIVDGPQRSRIAGPERWPL